MALTQELGRFAATLSFEKLPPEAMEIARTGFIDTVATMIAGAQDPAPQLLRKGLQPAPAIWLAVLRRGTCLPPACIARLQTRSLRGIARFP